MSKFNASARRVRDSRLPIPVRVAAFHTCLGSFCWLTRQKFQATRERFAAWYWIDKSPPAGVVGLRVRHFRHEFEKPDAQSYSLTQAIDDLQIERHGFLERLRRFSHKRIREKSRGRRQVARAEIEALYRPDFLVVK